MVTNSATQFTLIQDVPGFNADNIMVVVNNVIQEPVAVLIQSKRMQMEIQES